MNNKAELTKYLNLIIKIGVGVLTSIFVGFFVGYLVDRQLGLNGLPIMIGVLIGVIIGFFWIYSEVMTIDPE